MSGQRSHSYVVCFFRIKIAEATDMSPSPRPAGLRSHVGSRGRVGCDLGGSCGFTVTCSISDFMAVVEL